MNAAALVTTAAIVALSGGMVAAQETRDAVAITQFQRAADAYAFQHRQVERRLGEGADRVALAAGILAARPAAAEGDFFTPTVADAFRHRIAGALRTSGCTATMPVSLGSEVPRIGDLAPRALAAPGCLLNLLPRLPEELEYRLAGVAMILIDAHTNMVVDVLHGAIPVSP